jgi:hypothetical protein
LLGVQVSPEEQMDCPDEGRRLPWSLVAWVCVLGSSCQPFDGLVLAPRAPEDTAASPSPQVPPPPCEWSAPRLVRLPNVEYARTLVRLYGAPTDIARDLPPDPFIGGFDNHEDALTVSVTHLKAYSAAAARLADAIFGAPATRDALIGCDLVAQQSACLLAYVDRLGRLAYRRPLTSEEHDALLALAAKVAPAPDPFRPARMVFEAILQAPSFLYRFEAGLPDADAPGQRRRLTGYEVASRLSALLLSAGPDAALLAMAESGALDTPDGVTSAAQLLLRDPLAHDGLQRFAQQWLRLQQLDGITRTSVWSGWTADMPLQMRGETARLLEDHLWGAAGFLDLLVAPYTYVNGTLAQLYGIAAVAPGSDWQRVSLPSGGTRAGLLTHAGILTFTAPTEVTAPILRGKWVRDAILCSPPPPPPSGIPAAVEPSQGETVRQKLDQHRTDPACAGCHSLMDPVGFGFERYDSVGRYRESDPFGNALTGAGTLVGFQPPDFTGPLELAPKLQQSPDTARCLVTHLQRYAFNRTEVPGDQCVTMHLTDAFQKSGQSFQQLLLELVASDAFRYVGEIQ